MGKNINSNNKDRQIPIDEYKILNDELKNSYYDSLKSKIRQLNSQYHFKNEAFLSSIVVNLIWEYKELFPNNDTYILELSEFLNLLFKSINSDECIEIKFGSKKIKIQSEITKHRISYLINTLLVEELRDDFTLDTNFNLSKDYRFKNDLNQLIENFNSNQSIQFNIYSKILNLSTELLNNQELDDILNYAREKYSKVEIKKHSKIKRDELNNIIKRMIENLRKIDIFNKDLKTISTNEACFLYDVLGLSNIIESDSLLNNQEKYQHMKRYIKQ